jgi:hypothetical protein
MFGQPYLDQRTIERLVRRAGAGGEGRHEEASWSPDGVVPRGGTAAIALVRRRLGTALVGIGEWLRGAPAADRPAFYAEGLPSTENQASS